MSIILTVCDSCKGADWDETTAAQTHGAQLATLIEKKIENPKDLVMRRHSCLMGCNFACNISLQAEGKLTYVLGMFEPTEEAAAGIIEFARKYDASESGQVPFREWPQAIKGHFRARIPPAPAL